MSDKSAKNGSHKFVLAFRPLPGYAYAAPGLDVMPQRIASKFIDARAGIEVDRQMYQKFRNRLATPDFLEAAIELAAQRNIDTKTIDALKNLLATRGV